MRPNFDVFPKQQKNLSPHHRQRQQQKSLFTVDDDFHCSLCCSSHFLPSWMSDIRVVRRWWWTTPTWATLTSLFSCPATPHPSVHVRRPPNGKFIRWRKKRLLLWQYESIKWQFSCFLFQIIGHHNRGVCEDMSTRLSTEKLQKFHAPEAAKFSALGERRRNSKISAAYRHEISQIFSQQRKLRGFLREIRVCGWKKVIRKYLWAKSVSGWLVRDKK